MTADEEIDEKDEEIDTTIENPVTVDIRCACGNHARYLVLVPGTTICCALCAMKSPHRTMRIAENPRLVEVMEDMRKRMAFDAICAAAHMHAIVRGES